MYFALTVMPEFVALTTAAEATRSARARVARDLRIVTDASLKLTPPKGDRPS